MEDQKTKSPAFSSKALTPSEKMYANIERELLAIVWGAQKFHTYVQGRRGILWQKRQTAGVNLSETTEWGFSQATKDVAESH